MLSWKREYLTGMEQRWGLGAWQRAPHQVTLKGRLVEDVVRPPMPARSLLV